ncbi:hypothetical protein [[Clostridium] fimetarium]|uniref:Uncharacterized protein n=1 Tax=[Clostridium] fimetarium TaxID=99656 RepID=A0A1I0QXZ4_9FIRM|nr:hypothetical protein [[Clostridium] fimetarium]SEW32725.1 hypothetical protein SAMN05421659_11014 [[Clostridium] fimetarium]
MKYFKKTIIFTLVCIVLIVIIFFLLDNKINPKKNTETTSESFIITDCFPDYSSIIDEYQKFVDQLINEGIESVFDNEIFTTPDTDLSYNWNCMMTETNIWSYRKFPKNREAFGYALEDLNGNGTPELVLLLKDYTVLAVFSTVNGKPKLLDAYWPKHRCAIYNSGLLYTLSSGGSAYWEYAIHQISQDGSKLIAVEQYGSDDDLYKIINGEKYNISELELEEFQKKYPILSDTYASEITENSGIRFVSLFD